ncbi:polysaccharide biosynthesis tyrosine autokinase [Blastochloris sulfoviridis]|uniref:non-specific protein-tyrosine kinase n=2 Tax=Blastochloris sulfoviridis TaxID=50712 RepID=A0A5M6HU62_9HYPH|nr:polysaccharide biosynthesis tyrosine autokinase [Blastochloris sulfoviridis]
MSPISVADLIEWAKGFFGRQYWIFAIGVACALAAAIAYLSVTPPQYTATAMLMIDRGKVRDLQVPGSPLGDGPLDTVQVDTQVEVLRSDTIGLAVIRAQNLMEDPELDGRARAAVNPLAKLFSLFRSNAAPEPLSTKAVLGGFLSRRKITRVGKTYILEVSYQSSDPVHAANIANAIAEAYIDNELETKYQVTRRASTWLQGRIKELRAQAADADLAVFEYKEKNKIIDYGNVSVSGPGAASGRLIGDQQLSELNSQLMATRGATAEAKARLDRIEDVLKQDVRDATVADTLKNEIINRLRTRYLDMAAREASWSVQYGSNHLAAVNLRTQMDELLRSMSDELNRIAASYRSEFEIAKAREEALERRLAELVSESQSTYRDRIGLGDLESGAKVSRAIYDTFLQRYLEAMQQQSFPITEARVINPATPPSFKSSPIAGQVMGLGGAIGFILALGVALLRETTDGTFRTARQVEEKLQAPCLSVLPLMGEDAEAASNVFSGLPVKWTGRPTRRDTPEPPGCAPPLAGGTMLNEAVLRYVVEQPLSAAAEGFRAIKIVADIRKASTGNRIIGVTSTLPGEGKSTVACNLAGLMAHAGKRAILIDADLRKPSLGRSLTTAPEVGLLEVLADPAQLDRAVCIDAVTGLALLPSVVDGGLVHSDEIVSSEAFRRLLEQLRQRYDYIIVDLPPLAPVVDVRAIAAMIESFVFVVEWGRTKADLVHRHLQAKPEVYDRLLGVVLNKADTRLFKRYEQGSQFNHMYYVHHGEDRLPAKV